MKRIHLLLIGSLLCGSLAAQAPSGFNYQVVLRDASGAVKANTEVTIDISIVKSNASRQCILLRNTYRNNK
jgi:hypothetical protein